MNEILSPWLRKGVFVFIDGILIYSANWEEHLALVKQVLSFAGTTIKSQIV
jgi:hypothetical protein